MKIREDGTLAYILFKNQEENIHVPFTEDVNHIGPQWYGVANHKEYNVDMRKLSPYAFEGEKDNIHYGLRYLWEEEKVTITATLKNNGPNVFEPEKVGVKLGMDTYMDNYPQWNDKYFPTMLRCETNFFWGYFMSPLNKIIGICSPQPVASWHMHYNRVNGYGGHRIHTVNMDLLHGGPLPERHPQNLQHLMPGEEKVWTFYLMPIEGVASVQQHMTRACHVPMIQAERYTLTKNETLTIKVLSDCETALYIEKPNKKDHRILIGRTHGSPCVMHYDGLDEQGVYNLFAISSNGYETEAKIYVRHPWSWYLKQARKASISMEQKASTHLESWYGCFSGFLAAKHYPDEDLDAQVEDNFKEILPLMYDVDKGEPIIMAKRICNTASMVSLLVDAYEAKKDIHYLHLASKLADWLILQQGEDGAYRTETGWGSGREDALGEHYTSVIYMAKSMLELVLVEKELGKLDAHWHDCYERHYNSVQRAVDDLAVRKDNIGTEGEHTFEDGMLSCSTLQLAMFALVQEDETDKKKYTQVAEYMIKKHRCLEQMIIPDCRMNGGTIRFWEAQYDVLLDKNMINSPHGWTSWKTYATWYLYQLTGHIDYLYQTMDTLGACMQLIDGETGKLRWAFIVDPHVPVHAWEGEDTGKYHRRDKVISEQYVDMISGWYKRPKGKVSMHQEANVVGEAGDITLPEDGWCCDNDVHEHFKCLEEVALTSAYIFEDEQGHIHSFNCAVQRNHQQLIIKPYEPIVTAVHINIKHPFDVQIYFDDDQLSTTCKKGMGWLKKSC